MRVRIRTYEDLVEEVDVFFWRGVAVARKDRSKLEYEDIIYPEMIDKRDKERFTKWLHKHYKKPAVVLVKNIIKEKGTIDYKLVEMKPKQIEKSEGKKKLGKIYKFIKGCLFSYEADKNDSLFEEGLKFNPFIDYYLTNESGIYELKALPNW